jgi:hypothetical protein
MVSKIESKLKNGDKFMLVGRCHLYFFSLLFQLPHLASSTPRFSDIIYTHVKIGDEWVVTIFRR